MLVPSVLLNPDNEKAVALMKLPSLKECERAVGKPASEWVGRCHEVAIVLVDEGLVPGRAVYGHYLGPVAPGTLFARRAIVRHGWIQDRQEDVVRVVDPTRWVFEGKRPYIFQALVRGEHADYDEGGSRCRAALQRPAPVWDPKAKRFTLGLCRAGLAGFIASKHLDSARHCIEAASHVRYLLGPAMGPDHDVLTVHQGMWLANLPYDVLSDYTLVIYRALADAGHESWIPIDNWRRAQGELAVRLQKATVSKASRGG